MKLRNHIKDLDRRFICSIPSYDDGRQVEHPISVPLLLAVVRLDQPADVMRAFQHDDVSLGARWSNQAIAKVAELVEVPPQSDGGVRATGTTADHTFIIWE